MQLRVKNRTAFFYRDCDNGVVTTPYVITIFFLPCIKNHKSHIICKYLEKKVMLKLECNNLFFSNKMESNEWFIVSVASICTEWNINSK